METASAIAAIGIIATLWAGSVAFVTRHTKARDREIELRAAVEALQAHYRALSQLDNDATPVELLELALFVSETIHDPSIADQIAEMLSADPNAFAVDDRSPVDHTMNDAVRRVRSKRPDIVLAFHNALLTGIAALVLRRPDCRGAFPYVIINVATEPTEDAVRSIGNVLRLSRDKIIKRSAGSPGSGIAIPA